MQQITRSADLAQKQVIGVVSVNSIDFVKTVFDCFDNNQVVVFLSDEGDRYKIETTGASEIITPKSDFGWCDRQFTPKTTDEIAQISFTSGTTGKPKGVMLKHRALNDVVDRLIDIMEIDSSIREYIGIPVNYSFGFGRCRVVATAGGEFYIPENGFNPLEIRDMLLDGSINAISAVPSLWRTLFQCQELFGEETKAVKWIEIGSQYMSRAEKEQLRKLFPQAKIVQHYGLTEASRSTFLRVDRTEGKHLESVGKAYGKTDIKLSADRKITIKGPHVAETLLIEGQTKNNIDADGWHETNDLGAIEDGYVYYLGRADDLINCGGIKVSPDNIEKFIRETMNIQSGIAVARAQDPVRGEVILVGILKSAELDPQTVKDAAVKAAAAQNIESADAVKIMEFDEFPATATGKIQRNQLSKLYAAEMETVSRTQPQPVAEQISGGPDDSLLSDREKEIIAAWQSVLGVDHIDVNSNFFELGGDSLTAISVMVKMEKLGISREIAKGMLQGLSVRELAKRIETTDRKFEQEIITAWKSVLGVDHIDANSNFFELGGDSLTAISVMVKMEKLGISREIAKGMLQGLSVRELAGRLERSKDNQKTKTSHTISNEYTRTGMNINIVRGFLVFCVISGHWSAGFFGMLPSAIGNILSPVFANIFAAGTPGFAIIYGVSAGYSMFNIFNTDRSRLNKIISTTLLLLVGGICVLAFMGFSRKLVYGEVESFTDFTNSFYSVLSYYLLITATITLWFRAIAKFKNPVVISIFFSIILYCSYHYFFDHLGSYRAEGFVELAKIMIAAKYSYFNLAAGTMSGLAVGIILRQNVEKKASPNSLTWVGLALVAAGFVVCSHAGKSEIWLQWPRPIVIWIWLFYIGLILLALTTMNKVLLSYNQLHPGVKFTLQSWSTIGILAFPLFITHEMVLPLKDIMGAFGLPNSIALVIAMSLFIASFSLMFKKVHSANFTW